MTQTMREQLRRLIDEELQFINAIPDCDDFVDEKSAREFFVRKLESILATPDPAVTVRKGWVAKCGFGLTWFPERPYWDINTWICSGRIAFLDGVVEHIITDPWPDKPNGGPECVMEVG